MSKKHRKKKVQYVTQNTLMSEYHLTRSMIDKYLPEPVILIKPGSGGDVPTRFWKKTEVEKIISSNKELAAFLEQRAKRKEERVKRVMQKTRAADEFLQQFSPDDLIAMGRTLKRHFTLHVGPTNSGKTYQALQVLMEADTGMYLGPLRLLALEMFETINGEGIPCNLLTGEEYEEVIGAMITASTIELCNFERHVEVAVIDEAQLIADPFRGASWTNAICLVNADEVQVCMAPEALTLIRNLLEAMETPYDVVYHERLVPLQFTGGFRKLTEVRPGDALISFSRKRVLAISAALEKEGIRSSVIYGALPPAARREETRKFAEKETTVVVATDAIGMGISLPIKRIIFVETEKFDGQSVRPLKISEIRQIAGRAGRFGKYDLGEVVTMSSKSLIRDSLDADVPEITQLQIAFPKEALEYDYPLGKLLKQWDELPENELYARADMKEAEMLLHAMGDLQKRFSREILFALITCPVDIKNDMLVTYWLRCCSRIALGENPPRPDCGEGSLELCELKYQEYDVYHQILRRIGVEEDCLEDKERLCGKINRFLLKKKHNYLRRCKRCGRELPINNRFNLCEDCFGQDNFRKTQN